MIDQAARVRLLLALPRGGEALVTEVHDLYRYGDPAGSGMSGAVSYAAP